MKLTDRDIANKAHFIEVEPAALKALAIVESRGVGFLPDGRCKILFEGHIFWRQLVMAGIDPRKHAVKYPDVLYEYWDKTKYKGGAGEYERLEKAKALNQSCAIKSASWGMFQIMGFNYRKCAYTDIFDFETAMQQNEINHLDALCHFLKSAYIVPHIQAKNWAMVARLYNGPGYEKNSYHTKLEEAYNKYQHLNLSFPAPME